MRRVKIKRIGMVRVFIRSPKGRNFLDFPRHLFLPSPQFKLIRQVFYFLIPAQCEIYRVLYYPHTFQFFPPFFLDRILNDVRP